MKVYGITGGIGAGKSSVLSLLQEICASRIIMADDVAKSLQKPGEEGYRLLIDALGESILNADGTINKALLADIIFSSGEKLQLVNSILHPLTKTHIIEMIDEYRKSGEIDFVFVEAALLIEAHYEDICEEYWYVYAPREVRIKRLMESRGYSLQKCESIMDEQLSDDEYRKYCAFEIDNSGHLSKTREILEDKLRRSI